MTKEHLEQILVEGGASFTDFLSDRILKEFAKDSLCWIPVSSGKLPPTDKYVLLSFENFSIPEVGRWDVDENGNGAFCAGNDEVSLSSYGLFVNAWMPLPECLKEV